MLVSDVGASHVFGRVFGARQMESLITAAFIQLHFESCNSVAPVFNFNQSHNHYVTLLFHWSIALYISQAKQEQEIVPHPLQSSRRQWHISKTYHNPQMDTMCWSLVLTGMGH